MDDDIILIVDNRLTWKLMLVKKEKVLVLCWGSVDFDMVMILHWYRIFVDYGSDVILVVKNIWAEATHEKSATSVVWRQINLREKAC